MGAYNTVKAQQICPTCGNLVTFAIQFKYGDVWQYDYHIGDFLTWGGNAIGVPGHKRVVVDAIAENCSVCRSEGPEFELYLEDDQIIAVKPFSNTHDFVACQESYIVLEE